MKSYLAYEETGFDFLGEIPNDWGVKKLKYISSVVFSNVDKHTIEGEQPVKLCNYVDVYYNDFITSDMEFMSATALPREIDKFSLLQGDVLITKDSESRDDIAIPSFVRDEMNGVLCGYHLAQIRSLSVDSKFLFWVFGASEINDQYKVASNGITRYGLGKTSLENSFIPIPPLPEQKTIARFLDRKTVQIDDLIAKKQQQIDLLNEQRTALIYQAVTKGLNAGAPLKDSGVKWLGEIPDHWETWKLKYLCSTTKGFAFKSYLFTDDGVYVVKATNIKKESIINVHTFLNPEDADNYRNVELKKGDIIISTVGSKPHVVDSAVGQLAQVPAKYHGALLNQNTVRLETNRSDILSHEYLFFVLLSQRFRKYLNLHAHGTANQASINLQDIMSFIITLPPINEQQTIANIINNQCVSINKTITGIKKEIIRLKEYRTALISAAVTGKIDVRGEN